MSIPFDVLADPVRRRILDLLLERPRLVGELVERLGLTQPGTSKHLRVLREAGLGRVRQGAPRGGCELRPPAPAQGGVVRAASRAARRGGPVARALPGAVGDAARRTREAPGRDAQLAGGAGR